MSKMKIIGVILIIAVFGYVVGARYTDESKSVLNSMRQHAPENTLMYFESQSDEALIKFTSQYTSMMGDISADMSSQLDTQVMPEKLNEFYKGYMNAFSTLSQKGMLGLYEQFSIAVDGYSVFYLDGLMPVLHVEISDKQQFEKAFSAFSDSLETITISTVTMKAWSIPESDLKLAIHANDAFVTVALIDDTFDEQRKAQILALTPPAHSIIESNELTRINEQYQFNMIQGFINIEQIVASLLGEHSEFDQDLLVFGFDGLDHIRSSVSEQCKNEYLNMVKVTPKYVFGAKNIVITENEMSLDFNTTLEITNPALTQSLMTLNGHVPEYINTTDAMISFYYAAELANVVGFIGKWIPEINSQTFECDHLVTLQEKASPSIISKVALGMQMFKSIKSIGGTLYDLDLGTMNDFSGIDGFVSVFTSDPKNLALLASNIPQLQYVKITESPVKLPLVDLMLPDVPVYLQKIDNAVVGYSGTQSQAMIEKINAEPFNQNGLLAMRFDYADYMDLVTGAMYSGNFSSVLTAEQCTNSYKSMSLMKDFIGYLSSNVAFSPFGLDINSTIEYNQVVLKNDIQPGRYELSIFEDCAWSEPEKELINEDGTGYYEVTEQDSYSDESCLTVKADYNWKQIGKTLSYTETAYQSRDYCEDAFEQSEASELQAYSCEIYKHTDQEFECLYHDKEFDEYSVYRYRLKSQSNVTQ